MNIHLPVHDLTNSPDVKSFDICFVSNAVISDAAVSRAVISSEEEPLATYNQVLRRFELTDKRTKETTYTYFDNFPSYWPTTRVNAWHSQIIGDSHSLVYLFHPEPDAFAAVSRMMAETWNTSYGLEVKIENIYCIENKCLYYKFERRRSEMLRSRNDTTELISVETNKITGSVLSAKVISRLEVVNLIVKPKYIICLLRSYVVLV